MFPKKHSKTKGKDSSHDLHTYSLPDKSSNKPVPSETSPIDEVQEQIHPLMRQQTYPEINGNTEIHVSLTHALLKPEDLNLTIQQMNNSEKKKVKKTNEKDKKELKKQQNKNIVQSQEKQPSLLLKENHQLIRQKIDDFNSYTYPELIRDCCIDFCESCWCCCICCGLCRMCNCWRGGQKWLQEKLVFSCNYLFDHCICCDWCKSKKKNQVMNQSRV